MHLRWHLDAPVESVAVTVEVIEEPLVDELYFWALQVDWADEDGRPAGGAHLGLQWYRPHPQSRAVNWGGYGPDGRELAGGRSALLSATGNPNTRDLLWHSGEPHRLEVAPSPVPAPGGGRAWRATVSSPSLGTVVVRDLYSGGRSITAMLTWSEVFARCDDPPVTVRWSRPEAVDDLGVDHAPTAATVTYQSHADGGCANTDTRADDRGVLQRTATERGTRHGTVVGLPGTAP
jgi:hypothetical protein